MQTFLAFADFAKSASVLDNQRLGKQRVECKQIYLALTDPNYGWQHHPAVKMWLGYEVALCHYGRVICHEWLVNRGFNDSLYAYFIYRINELAKQDKDPSNPPWLGNEAFHLSHQSNLVRKNPEHYRKLFPDIPYNLPYVWPV